MTGTGKTKIYNLVKLTLLLSGLCLVFTAIGSEFSSAEAVPVRYDKPTPHTSSAPNALSETIGGFTNIKNVAVPGIQSLKLNVAGIASAVPVEAVIQNRPAPLVVVLLGIGGSANADFSKLWPEWFAAAGYNVLFFDSTFRPAMADLINRGPSGNLWSETEAVRDIISAFLQRGEMRGKITQIGVVGMSYGGLEALILGQMETAGKLPFQLAGIQAYSPPLDLQKTAAILDRWYDNYRWNYTLVQLMHEVGGYDFRFGSQFVSLLPRDKCANTPSDPMMKAAIAASFHDELAPVVVCEDSRYNLHLLPRGDEFNDKYVRESYAAQWGFEDYAYKLALAYWQRQLGAGAVERMLEDTRLFNLLQHQPASTETIIAANDPFDVPEDLAALKNWKLPTGLVTLIPRGGHLGYISEEWTKSKLLSLFTPPAREEPRR